MSSTPDAQPPSTPPDPRLFSVLGMVFGAIAVLIVPIVSGAVGMILAGVAIRKKEQLGKAAMGVAVIGTIAGILINAIIYSSTN